MGLGIIALYLGGVFFKVILIKEDLSALFAGEVHLLNLCYW